MINSVIKVQNLSKRYRLGLKEKQSETLVGQIGQAIRSPWENLQKLRKLSRFGIEDESVFWALKDINFEVKQGEVLGIIGKNGAGKSTLLKILSQITEPTSGKIEIYGRVASLLEVGTGFHPELSGRDNIYMNGTILGMTRREIDNKLDEIIDFSGVEKFIDTPVKFYSSGMKVRLGFAVAAHLDPEILIIDEVLAVGDAEFQRKCLGKMDELSKDDGRTVLFVSHDLSSVKKICTSAILLKNGKVDVTGKTEQVVESYQSKISDYVKPVVSGSRSIEFLSIRLLNSVGTEMDTFNTFESVSFEIEYFAKVQLDNVSFSICFDSIDGIRISSFWSAYINRKFLIRSGKFLVRYDIPEIHLSPGIYSIVLYIERNNEIIERIDNLLFITVGYSRKYGEVRIPERSQGTYIESFNVKLL